MSYEFALEEVDNRGCRMLIVIAALLFLAGWIVGRQWPMSEAAQHHPLAVKSNVQSFRKEPLLNDEAPARDSNTAKKLNPKVAPPAAEANATSLESWRHQQRQQRRHRRRTMVAS